MILENIIPLQVQGIIPLTPIVINKTSFNKKGPTIPKQSMGNKRVKRKYYLVDKTMAEVTKIKSKELIMSMECIHAQTLKVEKKKLEYLKERNKSFSQN